MDEIRSSDNLPILRPLFVEIFREQPDGNRELVLSWALDGSLPEMQETVFVDGRVSNLFSHEAQGGNFLKTEIS